MSPNPLQIAVFGSSEVKPNQLEYLTAIKLGTALGYQGWQVLTGGYYGVMEAVSKGVQSVNGKSIGVTLSSFDPKPPNNYLSVNHHEFDLFTRMRRLVYDSDAIVVLCGGLGTLAEFTVAWVLKQVGLLSKNYPIILLGNSFEKIANTAIQSLHVKKSDIELLTVVHTIEEVSLGILLILLLVIISGIKGRANVNTSSLHNIYKTNIGKKNLVFLDIIIQSSGCIIDR